MQVPGRGSMFYLSQRPYLVAGSLRDQLLYPFPPANVADQIHSRQDGEVFEHLPSCTLSEAEIDSRLEAALEAVELDYLLGRSGTASAGHGVLWWWGCCMAGPAGCKLWTASVTGEAGDLPKVHCYGAGPVQGVLDLGAVPETVTALSPCPSS